MRSLKSAEALRLIAVAVVVAGAVVLGELILNGGHGSSGSTHSSRSGGGAGAGGDNLSASSGAAVRGSSSQAQNAVVAAGPAVQRALRSGYLTVVVDEPPSGLFSEQNRSIARGAAVAASEINSAGGLTKDVRLRLLNQSLDGLSQPAVRARLSSEGAGVLVLPCDTESQESLSAGASQWGMLMLAPCNSDSGAGARYATYWPVGMAANDEAGGLTSYMKQSGLSRVFVVSAPGNRYAELLTGDFRSAAEANGIEITGSASIAPATQNFSSLARSIREINPPPAEIYTPLPPPFVNQMAKGLLANGLELTVIGSAAMETPLTLSAGSQGLEDAIFPSYGFARLNAAARRFEAEYRARFGKEPVGAFPGLGFETIRLLDQAVRKGGSAEPSAIERALAGGITLRGVALADRTYEPGGDHNPVGGVAIARVSEGGFVHLVATLPKGAPAP